MFEFFSLWVSAGQLFVAGQRRGGTSCRKSFWSGSNFYQTRYNTLFLVIQVTGTCSLFVLSW